MQFLYKLKEDNNNNNIHGEYFIDRYYDISHHATLKKIEMLRDLMISTDGNLDGSFYKFPIINIIIDGKIAKLIPVQLDKMSNDKTIIICELLENVYKHVSCIIDNLSDQFELNDTLAKVICDKIARAKAFTPNITTRKLAKYMPNITKDEDVVYVPRRITCKKNIICVYYQSKKRSL
jgi:ribosomal 50S subunit-associated protein YjgA (DUF615 family)